MRIVAIEIEGSDVAELLRQALELAGLGLAAREPEGGTPPFANPRRGRAGVAPTGSGVSGFSVAEQKSLDLAGRGSAKQPRGEGRGKGRAA